MQVIRNMAKLNRSVDHGSTTEKRKKDVLIGFPGHITSLVFSLIMSYPETQFYGSIRRLKSKFCTS